MFNEPLHFFLSNCVSEGGWCATYCSVVVVLQVIDIHDVSPENGLEWCHLLPDVSFRVLVCGGDGTIGWVLNAIESLALKVCVLSIDFNPSLCVHSSQLTSIPHSAFIPLN